MPELLSRRAFLKLLAGGFFGSALAIVGFEQFFRSNKNDNDAAASTSGSWSRSSDTIDVAIHAALIGDGRIFYLAGSGLHSAQIGGPFRHAVWDPATNTHSASDLDEDLFCVGMATLANGNVLLAGGTQAYDSETLNGRWQGLNAAYEVDFDSGSVGNRSEMAHGRWYPTCIEMTDGKVLVTNGWDEYGCRNYLAEIYDPQSKSWSIQQDPNSSFTYCVGFCAKAYYPEAGKVCYQKAIPQPQMTLYPRMHLLPNGRVYSVGQGTTDRSYDPSNGSWHSAGRAVARAYGTSVLLPLQNSTSEEGKILICGGSSDSAQNAVSSVEIAEPSGSFGLSRRSVQSMAYARRQLNPVILPIGQIAIFGGNSIGNRLSSAVYPAEVFDPTTETWSTLPAATIPRLYHGVALLMQDGRVWTASTNLSKTHKELRTEIFSPSYVTEPRPTITGPITGGAYGNTITFGCSDASEIEQVSLVKQSSTTHHYNTDQRLLWLQISSKSSSTVTVNAPVNDRLAPPGMYLIHAINSAGVPSVGQFIKIPGPVDTGGGGGGTFTSIYKVTATNSYLKLYTGSLRRVGEWLTSSSVLLGQSIRRVNVILKKSGNPTGTIRVVVRRGSNDSVGLDLGTIDAATLTTTDQTFTLTAASSYTLGSNDKVLVEWDGEGNSTDQVLVKRRFSSDPSTGFDGTNTRQSHYISSYSSHLGSDLAGEWFK